ncbi:Dihydrolipoamide acyltransferase [Giardia duodenalis]|uniref:Dihydrolipoamide acyltransferase n=1 Tax=Giardia intestinalis TaxID=5741 RepID=V6T7K9_GIAIN|nr:Dihydrolipoamide acyltransferase [Giardia intestinalis]
MPSGRHRGVPRRGLPSRRDNTAGHGPGDQERQMQVHHGGRGGDLPQPPGVPHSCQSRPKGHRRCRVCPEEDRERPHNHPPETHPDVTAWSRW